MAPGFTLPSQSWTGPGREAYSGTPQISADAALNDVADHLAAQPLAAADSPFVVHRLKAAGGAAPTPAAAGSSLGQWRSEQDLELARRAAFLNGGDSMAGLKAVRELLSDEARNRGVDISAGGSIPAIKFLEQQLAGARRQPNLEGVQADATQFLARPEFDGTPAVDAGPHRMAVGEAITAQPLSSQPVDSRAAAAALNGYLQGPVADRARASQEPPGQPASWQSAPVSITAPRQEPGRDTMLAAHAALGEKPLTTPGEAVLAVGAGNAYGTRGGQFKPGNTVNLGEIPKDKLPPRNSTGYYSGAAIGDLRGYQFGNPGNYQQLF